MVREMGVDERSKFVYYRNIRNWGMNGRLYGYLVQCIVSLCNPCLQFAGICPSL